jgi:hypothetical protein
LLVESSDHRHWLSPGKYDRSGSFAEARICGYY